MWLLLFIWSSLSISTADHAIYISVVDMTISDDRITGEIKVFSDDLYDALLDHHGDDLVSTVLDVDQAEAQEYFSNHVKIMSSDGANVPLTISRIYIEGDSHRLQFEVEDESSIALLQVSYFYELFPTQQNIVSITKGDQKSYYRFQSATQVEQITTH